MGPVIGGWGSPLGMRVIYPDMRTLNYFFIMADIDWKEVDWSTKE